MEKIKLDDFTKYHFISNVQVESNTSKCLFCVSKAKEDLSGYDKQYMIYDGNVHVLSNLINKQNVIWLNENELLFQSRADEFSSDYSVYRLSDDSTEIKFQLPLSSAQVTICEQLTVVISKIDVNCPDFYLMNLLEKKKWNNKCQEDMDYQIIDEIPFYYNAKGYVNKKRNALFVMENDEISSLTRISNPLMDVKGWCVLERKIYFLADTYDCVETRKANIYEYDVDTKRLRIILENDSIQFKTMMIEHDKLLLYGSDYQKHGKHQNLTLYSFDLNKMSLEIYADLGVSTVNSVGSDCRYGTTRNIQAKDKGMYYISTRGHHSYLCFTDETQNEKIIIQNSGTVDDFHVSDHSIYFVAMHDMKLQELYCYDKKTQKVHQCTELNESILKHQYIAKLEPLSSSTAEYSIDGYVLKPINFDPTKKYPAILTIHGGPNTVYGEVFFHEMQYWASEGYFVMFCNPFGSDGKGDKFMDIRGKYGTIDYDALMDFTDHVLITYPMIDQNRVAVTGGSYGGFMVNWIIGHTNRFACAVSQRSISNFISLAGVSDLGYRFAIDQCNTKNVPDHFDTLWWHSPVKYAHLAKTPTLFIHSDEDARCPLEQGIQMVTALMNQNVPTKLVMFHGENHELSRSGKPKHRIHRLKEITEWMNQYTK